jgi:hypothetical protein
MLEMDCDARGVINPFNRTQALQNQQFLRELRRTGNIRLAARQAGLKYGTVQHRRARHPAFAHAWDAALAFAPARLNAKGLQGPTGAKPLSSDGAGAAAGLRTLGGEAVITRRNDGKLQMRAAQPGKLTRDCEQAFLASLSVTANVRLSAAAAGASVAAFYRRRRNNPAFAREMRMALEQGYEALQTALLASASPASHEDDAWRHNEPPAMPPMTVNQALQLMYLHQKEARLLAEPPHLRRRMGESRDMHSFRLGEMWEEQRRRERERFEVAEAARRERGEPNLYEAWRATAGLPDLGQVTGWSKADPAKVPHDPDRALFGGWRLKDVKKKGR